MTLEERFLKWVSLKISNNNNAIRWYLGPINSAHLPAAFVEQGLLVSKFRRMLETSASVRTTAAVYDEPHRTLDSACGFWCFCVDFDFDRGRYEGMSREMQEESLLQALRLCWPTAAVKTQNGYHLYWVLRRIHSIDKHAYPATLLTETLGADHASASAVQCMVLRSEYPKEAHMVPRLHLAGHTIELFPQEARTYTLQKIITAFSAKTSPALSKLQQMVVGKQENKVLNIDRARRAIEILDTVDVQGLLEQAGCQPRMYNGGKKLTMLCPYHNDKNPSAYLITDVESPMVGFFCCKSASCGKQTTVEKLVKFLQEGED